MRRFAAAAALFAIGLSGRPAHAAVSGSGPGPGAGHGRPAAQRRAPSARGTVIGRESLAAVRAAGTARATATETAAAGTVTVSSWLRLSGGSAPTPTDLVITPETGSAELAADPGTFDRLRRVLDPQAAAALFTVASDVRRMGPARVAGQVAVRYRLSLELPARPDLDPAMAEEIAALRQAGLSTVTADVWLDQAKRPVRVTVSAAGPGAAGEQRVDLRYSDWGTGNEPAS